MSFEVGHNGAYAVGAKGDQQVVHKDVVEIAAARQRLRLVIYDG